MRKTKKGILVVCSGGLDSTAALALACRSSDKVEAVTFCYGQNHARREGRAVRAVCAHYGVRLTEIKLPFIGREFKSSLLGGEVPEGHYAAKSMKSTVVPFRNGIMISVAAGLAASRGLREVWLGNHGGDHFIYPDCRTDFIDYMDGAVYCGTGNKVRLVSPFCDNTKADIVRLGAKLGAPLALTYSCYKGGSRHCGRCGTCVERREAFKLARVPDPTKYEEGR